MSIGFIRYRVKCGKEYAAFCKAERRDGCKTNNEINLGRVIDKEKGIFRNRERGLFMFSIEQGYSDCIEYPEHIAQEKLLLDFGDSWLLSQLLESSGIQPILQTLLPMQTDTLMSLLFYRILGSKCASQYALTWWEGSYARQLFPEALLISQRISDFYKQLGNEQVMRAFFNAYLPIVSPKSDCNVLIDSTGLPNEIDFPLTAVNVHNGIVSQEMRLILVLDKNTKMPLYFRYVAGNIVDVSTLKTTLSELHLFGISVNHAIIDAGYYSGDNLDELRVSSIPYLVRVKANLKMFKNLVKEHSTDLETAKNAVVYRDRIVYIKCVPITEGDTVQSYAYLAVDADGKHEQKSKYLHKHLPAQKLTSDEIDDKMKEMGIFALLSSQLLDIKEVLPLYYMRQAVEQVFDISKNYAELLPLRVHSEQTLRGHLLISFIATVLLVYINQQLEGSTNNFTSAFLKLRNLKCKVFNAVTVVAEPTKQMKDIIKHLKLTLPDRV